MLNGAGRGFIKLFSIQSVISNRFEIRIGLKTSESAWNFKRRIETRRVRLKSQTWLEILSLRLKSVWNWSAAWNQIEISALYIFSIRFQTCSTPGLKFSRENENLYPRLKIWIRFENLKSGLRFSNLFENFKPDSNFREISIQSKLGLIKPLPGVSNKKTKLLISNSIKKL